MWIDKNGNPEDIAHRFSLRRSAMFLAILPVYVLSQIVVALRLGEPESVRWSTLVGTSLLTVMLLVTVANGGAARKLPAVIFAAINDDVTKANRLRAQQTGFWAAIGAAALAFGAASMLSLNGLQGVHFTISIATAAAVLHFALLERRALKS
jgi:hypothetical protein